MPNRAARAYKRTTADYSKNDETLLKMSGRSGIVVS